MAGSPGITPIVVSRTYAELRRGVEETLVEGQRRIEQTKVRTYWETGRIIGAHLALHADEPNYGTETVRRLARDLSVGETVLYRCVQFADRFPIFAHGQRLSWAHYRLLIPVADAAEREALEQLAIEKAWTSPELAEQVRVWRLRSGEIEAVDEGSAAAQKPLAPVRGTAGICRVAAVGGDGALAVDLGFTSHLDLRENAAWHAGDFVKIGAEGAVRRAADATKADLFTYAAEILKVVDGDTLWLKLYLEPQRWLKEKVRLRGIDCPELATAEGKAAKRFVEALVARTAGVVVSTTKPDKYDRYLADVFLSMPATDDRAAEEVFLNNRLLERGHAVRKEVWEFGDWGE